MSTFHPTIVRLHPKIVRMKKHTYHTTTTITVGLVSNISVRMDIEDMKYTILPTILTMTLVVSLIIFTM